MSTKKTLSKLERVPLREAWRDEALEFTPWLAEADNLSALADALGLDELELVNTERSVGDFKLDILCSDVKLLKALGYHNLGLDGVKVLLEDYDVPQRLLHIVDLLEF